MAQRQPAQAHRDRRPGEPRSAARARDRVRPPRSHARGPAHRSHGARAAVVAAGVPPRPRTAWRRWGYRLLPGDAFSYVLHLLPAEWPIMAAHTALGYLLAVGMPGAARGERLGPGLWALVIWGGFLNGGTLPINSGLGKERGENG